MTDRKRPGAGVLFHRPLGDRSQGGLGEAEFGVLHGEQRLVLLDQGVLRLGQHANHGVEVQRPQRRDDRQAADQLGNHAELEDVVAGDLLEQIAQFQLIVADAFLGEADGAFAQSPADDVVEPDERAAADEQDVAGVHLDVLLLGMLAAALRRHVGDRCLRASSARPAARPRPTRRG